MVHLRAFPANFQSARGLDSWLINLVFETAMEYPIESVRKAYHEEKRKSFVGDFDDSDLIEAGYTPEELEGK
jgi:predicted enzyme involved in methoxymalonyl-ACP biosynthesis